MKSFLKILVLGVVPILAATAVVDQGLAADDGSQLIFQVDMDDKNFISVTNTGTDAVTVLTQYYNDEMKQVLWYLRVITSNSTVLVDPFDHEIPGTAEMKDGKPVAGTATNVREVFDGIPDMSTKDDAGKNSGRMVIAVTAVGANVNVDVGGTDTANAADTVNVLFPGFLVKGMHKTDNIDECGQTKVGEGDNHTVYQPFPTDDTDGTDDCKDTDTSTKNVGDLSVDNAEPVVFNHLLGHYTSAMIQTAAGGSDQTASWGGTALVRPAVDTTANTNEIVRAYVTLNGANASNPTSATGAENGRLAEMDAGGSGGAEDISTNEVTGYTLTTGTGADPDEAKNGTYTNRGLNGGALLLPALHGGGAETHQVMQLLSAADDFGGAGKYMLIAAKTGYKVTLMDNMGDALPDPAAESGPVFGGVDAPKPPPGVSIIVEGIQVMTNANLDKCTGDKIAGAWTLADLTSIVPTAGKGAKDFDGLDANLMPQVNASPGWVKFARNELTCEKDFGDGDIASGTLFEDPDGVPATDKRTYTTGTLVEEQLTDATSPSTRTFVTTGQAVLKFITAESTFAASWSLGAPASPAN